MNADKSYVLLIDSATEVCSVALGKMDGTIVAAREERTPNKHSELLAPFADELLRSIPGGAKEGLCGVVISEGPGSYTGLRIGASYAKGLCWALGLPLVAITTTEALAYALAETAEGKRIMESHPEALLLPMIDARRMEVYTAVYDRTSGLYGSSEIRALVLTDDQDKAYLKEIVGDKEIIFFGSGASKAQAVMEELFGSKAFYCTDITADAKAMISKGTHFISEDQSVDVGYWTPFYLKEFQATIPKKKY